MYRNNLFKAALIQNAFPEALEDKSLEELYGAGPFDNLPASTPLIEIAGDGETAKGLWYCHGTAADLTPGGVASTWSWGYYCADFVKEDGAWRFWHLCWLNDIVTLCGQTWTKPNVPYPPLPEFADVEKLALPAPTVACTVRELYRPDRPFTPTPPLPEPYLHFSETFSYGYQEVAQ